MNILTCLKLSLLFVFLLGTMQDGMAQKNRKNRKDRVKKNKKSIMDDLPSFFVDDSRLPKYLKAIYRRDAARISVRLINNELRLSKQTVEIPEELVQAIYNALVAIRTSDYAAVDTIATKYYVRSFPVPNVEKIVLVAEHDAKWLEPLRRRQNTTGSEGLNELIQEHNLIPSKLVTLDEERTALVLQSRNPINVPALMMRFFVQEGIGSIEEVLPYGDGNDIAVKRTKDGWDIEYSVKFGNCSLQCQKAHKWYFSVTEEGEVIYSGSNGHTIPPWIKGSRFSEQFPDVLAKN